MLGTGPLRAGAALFLLASFFGYLSALHPSFSTAGYTAALVLVFSSRQEHWHLAWYRVLYTLMGAFVAFGVGALLWPVRAREDLRAKLASILEGCGTLYRAVTAAATEGAHDQKEIEQLGRRLHDLRRGITQQMDEARNELTFSRFNPGAYQAFVDLTDQVRRRLTAMAEDSNLYVLAQVQPDLVPSLPALAKRTTRNFSPWPKLSAPQADSWTHSAWILRCTTWTLTSPGCARSVPPAHLRSIACCRSGPSYST